MVHTSFRSVLVFGLPPSALFTPSNKKRTLSGLRLRKFRVFMRASDSDLSWARRVDGDNSTTNRDVHGHGTSFISKTQQQSTSFFAQMQLRGGCLLTETACGSVTMGVSSLAT